MRPETAIAITEFSQTAEGWCTLPRAMEMAELIVQTKPMVVVEIGVFAGGSLVPQALGLKENGGGHIYGIDPWSREAAVEQVFVSDDHTAPADEAVARQWWTDVDLEKMHQLCMQGIWRYSLEEFAIVIRARSEHAAQLFEGDRPIIDVLYIDGNHSELASCRDVELYLHMVRKGGFLWFDDAHWTSTQKAVRMIEERCELERDHESYRLYRVK